MQPRQSLEEDHTEAYTLEGVEYAEPQPQRARNKRGCERRPGPREKDTDVGGGPEDLGPAGCDEADCEERENPGVGLGELGEEKEKECPHDYEEEDGQEGDLVDLRRIAAPEVLPVATCGGGKEVVLNDDDNKKPDNDVTAHDSLVE